jgi:hypothetical protein
MRASSLLAVLLFALPVSAQDQCTLKIDQSPEVRGLKLGMSLSGIQKIFPDYRPKDNESFGAQVGLLTASRLRRARGISYEGVRAVWITLVDGYLASFEVAYDGTYKWSSVNEFTDKLSETLKIPKAWEATGESARMVVCSDFYIKAAIPNYGESQLIFTKVGLDGILRERREESEKRKKETFKP